MKQLLVVGNIESIFIKELADNLSDGNCQIDFLDIIKAQFRSGNSDKKKDIIKRISFLKKLPLIIQIFKLILMKRFIHNMSKYDCVSIHYIDPVYGLFFSRDIKNLGKKIVSSVWGTDFHGSNFIVRHFQKKIYNISDSITFSNETVIKEFSKYYNRVYDCKIKILRFGISTLDNIKQVYLTKIELCNYFNIARDSFVITCGYNGRPSQNHESVIYELFHIKRNLPEKTVIVLPMTYSARPEYISKIEKLLKRTGFKYIIFKNFLTYKELAYMRCLTDLFIHVQNNDAFSASMQEHLFAGSIVINGAWLPYNIIKHEGGFFLEVKNINELNNVVLDIMDDMRKLKIFCNKNKKIIWNLSSWEKNINGWRELLCL